MPSNKVKSLDYQKLTSRANRNDAKADDQAPLKPSDKQRREQSDSATKNLFNRQKTTDEDETPSEAVLETKKTATAENFISAALEDKGDEKKVFVSEQRERKKKKLDKDRKLLSSDRWLARNGHYLTYVGLYLFSILVLFRPYELIPSLSFLSATAFYFGAFTLAVYIPTQLTNEGNLTSLSTEVKAIGVMFFTAFITISFAKDPELAWATFSDSYIRCVVIFIVMINVLRTRRRLLGMIWLSISIGVVLSYMALGMYMRGEMKVEGYRVGRTIGGMFENPNEMSLHLVMMIPLAVSLAVASKSKLMRVVYLAMTGIMLFANMITYSRGGFLALIASSVFLIWKLGRKNRIAVSLVGIVIGILLTLLAPGNFGLRVLSIFIPGLDQAGSSGQRQELLKRSIIVTLRNPWGIGIGNFPIVSVQNLVSHNAYTQVSSEIGVIGLAAYLVFIVSPFRKLAAIERAQFAKDELNWFYYLSIGLQASFVSFWVASFFASVAYYWFIYYLVAYAVAFRRIYQVENNLREEIKTEPIWQRQTA